MSCRFEIHVEGRKLFYCAAMANGWAWLWSHNDEDNDPCPCKKKIEGDVLTVSRELSPNEFWSVSGQRVREEDWEEWKKRRSDEA